MRIFALLTDGFGARGGIARYNSDLMLALSKSSRVAQVIALPRRGSSQKVAPSKFIQLDPTPEKMRWCTMALGIATTSRSDIIFCGHMNAAPLAAALARAAGAKLWLQVHGIEAWSAPNYLWRLSIEHAHLVTAVSRFTRSRFLRWADIEADRVRVLPNTLSRPFRPRARREDLLYRYSLIGKRVILTIGRLAADEGYKGHDRVMRALPFVAARCPNVVYLIIGPGSDRARLSALARELGVIERVIFTGEIEDDDLSDHFALADVYAMPSIGEGFGIVFLEAAASGVPVIGGNRDGSRDALADGRIGQLIDPYDENALQSALLGALASSGSRDGSADLEREVALERFAFAHFARHAEELATEVMST